MSSTIDKRRFEVNVKLVVHTTSLSEATRVVEQRLRAGTEPLNDPDCLIIQEMDAKAARK